MIKQFFTFLLLTNSAFGQSAPVENYLLWSPTRKLTTDDFAIKTKQRPTNPSFAQYTIDVDVHGFDFLTRNFNKKVRNYFIKSASWIDTTADTALLLRYQQTLFDLCEVYTRRFRKELTVNRRKIVGGMDFVKIQNAKTLTEFSQRRIAYDTETGFGSDEEKQVVWKIRIEKELSELKDFAYDR
jgi:hypothetical protein